MREKIIENYLVKQTEKRGGFTRKYTSPSHRGVPDRIVFLPNFTVFVEVKNENGRLSKLQKREIERMRKTGANVVIVDSAKAVDNLMEEYDNAQSNEL